MRIPKIYPWFMAVLALFLSCVHAPAQFAAPPPPIKTISQTSKPASSRKLHWWEKRQPAAATPKDLLALADSLAEEGKLRSAATHYRALTYAWPDAKEASIAQFKYAGILHKQGKHKKAFDEYQYLLTTYAGFVPYDTVLEQQYAIAYEILNKRKRLLFFSYENEEEAIPMLEQIIANAPAWRLAPDLQYRIARIYEKNKSYDLALDSYSIFQHRHTGSPLKEEAYLGYARCWKKIADKSPRDSNAREQAINAQVLFLSSYPRSSATDTIRIYLLELKLQQASYLYQQARLYDIMSGHRYDAAKTDKLLTAAYLCYERLLREFPESHWQNIAKERMDQIEQRQKPKNVR